MDTNQLQLENEKLNARLEKAKEVFRQQAADIKAKDEAYLKLRDEYNEVVRERDIHLEANAKFNKQILEAEELIKEYNALVLRYDDLYSEHNLLNEQFADLEKEYTNSEELRKSYTEATNKLNEEVSRLQDIIISKDDAYKNLESTYNDASVEHVRDVNALKYTIEQLKEDLKKNEEKLTNALAEVDKQDNIILGLNEVESEWSSKLADALNTISNLSEELSKTKNNYEDVLSDRNALVSRMDVVLDTIDGLKETVEKKDTEIESLKNEINSLNDVINHQDIEAKEVRAKVETKVAEVKRAIQTLNDGLGDDFNIFG